MYEPAKKKLSTQVKICGLSDVDAIDAAIDGGASHIGFIFFRKSPRNISPELAGELAQPLAGKVQRVAVSVNADNAFLDQIVKAMVPDNLQLHGSETPQRVLEIRQRYNLPVLKAFAIRQQSDFGIAENYFEVADRLLFDAKPPKGSQLPGGNGVSFDWNLFARWQDQHYPHIAQHGSNGKNTPGRANSAPNGAPVDNVLDLASLPMLSGGINPDNIIEALASSNAWALDVSSGVESAPGIKDPGLIKSLLGKVYDFDQTRTNG